jgi:hypothetical protein
MSKQRKVHRRKRKTKYPTLTKGSGFSKSFNSIKDFVEWTQTK